MECQIYRRVESDFSSLLEAGLDVVGYGLDLINTKGCNQVRMTRGVVERYERDLPAFLDPPGLVVAAALGRIRTKGGDQVRLACDIPKGIEVRETGCRGGDPSSRKRNL